jgi:D-sedoheptulose 7-phosphate isomerase
MDYQNILESNFKEHELAIKKVFLDHSSRIQEIGKILANVLKNEGTIFWCGNGGSASDSQHLAAELVGRFKKNRRALRSVALNTDTSVITCIANDYSYEDIFSRQIEGLARKGDFLIAISTSGNSHNILNAIIRAKELGIKTLALLGKDGGEAKKIADDSLIISSESTARIQESHILIGHILCEIIEAELGIS